MLGFVLLLAGALLDFVALSLAPQSLLAPLAALTLVWNMVIFCDCYYLVCLGVCCFVMPDNKQLLATKYMKEKLEKRDRNATMVESHPLKLLFACTLARQPSTVYFSAGFSWCNNFGGVRLKKLAGVHARSIAGVLPEP